jgi:release factor glutamine methyltransferase
MSKILKEVLQLSTEWLAKSKSDSPRFEAEWLIGHALGLTRLQLYTNHDRTLMENELDKVRTLLRRRVAGEPLQYICGEMDFYGLTLSVGPGVLIPRNDTEILVDHARRLLKVGDRVLDLCTGSACIPLALQKSFKGGLSIDAVELSPEAFTWARRNVDKTGLAVNLFEGDLFAPVAASGPYALISANPPYIARDEAPSLAIEVRDHEPHLALFAEDQGLELLRRIATEAPLFLIPGGWLLCEIGWQQGPAVSAIFAAAGLDSVRVEKDHAGHDRVVIGRNPA